MGAFSLFHLLFMLVFAVVGLGIYFVPTIVAVARKHEQTGLVFLVNVLAGWSGIGWLLTLLWAAGVFGRSR